MEDAHTHILSLHDDKNAAFFAVYDGHGGAKVAEYAGHHLHERIFSQQAYSKREFQSFLLLLLSFAIICLFLQRITIYPMQ